MALPAEHSLEEVCAPLPAGYTIRRATRDDNPTILAFQSQHAMQTDIGMQFDRAPDFFALLDAHSPYHETLLVVEGESVRGIGTVVLRPAYVDGRVVSAAYLGDLFIPHHRVVSRVWAVAFKRLLKTLQAEAGVEFIYGCVIRSNHLARSSLVASRRADRAAFARWRGYSNVSILARKPWTRPALCIAVRRAGPADSERLRVFLDEQSKETTGGVVFDAATWQRRLASWPQFGVDRFYLAEDGSGRILGCLAPWDLAALKRIVLLDTGPSFRAIKRIFNVVAPLIGKPPIGTGQGSTLPNIYLSHIAIRDRRADVFRALLDCAYRDLAATRRYATVSLCLYDGDPLWEALRGYWYVEVPMDLYVVSADGGSPDAASPGPSPGPPPGNSPTAGDRTYPGFEIYLV